MAENTEAAFSSYVPGMYKFNEAVFRDLRAHMRVAPAFTGTCAVVATSSTLLKRTDGARIDKAHTVIRVNSIPMLPHLFRAHTGSRTDVLVTTFDRWTHTNLTSHAQPVRVFYCVNRHVDRCWTAARNDGLFRVSPGFVRTVQRMHGIRRWPSTGLVALSLANVLCDRVEAYGVGIDSTFSNCSHYYNADGGDPAICTHQVKEVHMRNTQRKYALYSNSTWHDFSREAIVLRNHPALDTHRTDAK